MSTLLLLPVAWVPVPFGFRWSLPADSRSYEGLGGGIAWALDPAFCEQLLSRLVASDAAADAERSRSLDSHECSLEC